MTIADYKDILLRLQKYSPNAIADTLRHTLAEIAFLESIYMTGAPNNHYSRAFADAAAAERTEKCKVSSACYSLLRQQDHQEATP